MISVKRFDREDLNHLHHMLESQSHPIQWDFPTLGYIAYEGSIPVAAGFLRQAEGGVALFDGLVSNKDLPSNMRHEALTIIVNTLIDAAKELKLQGILAFTTDESVVKRAEVCGFTAFPQTALILNLGVV